LGLLSLTCGRRDEKTAEEVSRPSIYSLRFPPSGSGGNDPR
jgi:hypothetical protein